MTSETMSKDVHITKTTNVSSMLRQITVTCQLYIYIYTLKYIYMCKYSMFIQTNPGRNKKTIFTRCLLSLWQLSSSTEKQSMLQATCKSHQSYGAWSGGGGTHIQMIQNHSGLYQYLKCRHIQHQYGNMYKYLLKYPKIYIYIYI